MISTPPVPDDLHLSALQRHAVEAVSFQGLKAGMSWWHDEAAPSGTGAALPFVDTGFSWIGVGTPLVEPEAQAAAVRRFIADARGARRRPVFFGVERLEPYEGCRRLPIGRQSTLWPSAWAETLRRRPKLREQVRRARAKGVTVRRVRPAELAAGTPLRATVAELGAEWLASRRMEPMAFLVAVEPFHAPAEHVYLVAEREGRLVEFLSAVPIYGRRGWLVEDVLRGPEAPNGTTELVLDRLMRELGEASGPVTPGLTPLAGRLPLWLRLARTATVALYDFAGLERFRARLLPSRWDPVWMVWESGAAPLVLFDVLRAFAGRRIVAFAWRSLVRYPGGPPWAVAVPLVGWTCLLAALVVMGRASILGFSTSVLAGWVIFDVLLAWLLFKAARRPRRGRLVSVAVLAGADAVLSLRHLAQVGLGAGVLTGVLRLLATLGPLMGVTALVWAIRAAGRPLERSRGPSPPRR